jgi:hypothetical protein
MKSNANSKLNGACVRSPEDVAKAIQLWAIYAHRYSTNLEVYSELLQKKADLKIRRRPISKNVLDDYPEIKFLRIKSKEEALAYLLDLSIPELGRLIEQIEGLEYNYTYKTVVNWVIEAEYKVSHYGLKASGVNPDAIGTTTRRYNRGVDTKN